MAKKQAKSQKPIREYLLALGFVALVLTIPLYIVATETNTDKRSQAATALNGCSASYYDTTVLNDNPVAYWQLGDNGTTVTDCATGQAHQGTYTASPAATTLPNGDGAKAFNGATQYAEIPDADDLSVPTTGILTIEAWMRPDVLEFPHQESTGYVHWMGKGKKGQAEYVSRMYSYTNSENRPNRISGYAFSLTGGLGTGGYFQDPVTAGEWIHYTFIINTNDTSSTYPTGYGKLYKNGVKRDQDSLSDFSVVPGNGTDPFRIGTRDFNSFFQGAIGKVAMYNYELSQTQIANHYQAMVNPPTATPQPTDTPTPTPTATPTPLPTNTPIPTATPVPSDITPPTVAITSPLNNAVVARGRTTTITASASDNVGVLKVEFYVNNALKCTDTTAAYSCSWAVPSKRNVTYTLKAIAQDTSGNRTASSTVTVIAR